MPNPQFIRASWFSDITLKKVINEHPVKKQDFIKEGYRPTGKNGNGILCIFEDMPLAYYDLPTSNNQIFRKALWESLLQNKDLLFRMNQSKSFWGEPFHADELEVKFPNVSHKVQTFRIAESGLVRGNVAVLDTPNGNIIYSLSLDGMPGISSRGFGTLEDANDGVNQIVSEADYIHVSWDFVGVPAVKEAIASITQHVKNFRDTADGVVGSLVAASDHSPELKKLAAILQSETKRVSVTVPKNPIHSEEAEGMSLPKIKDSDAPKKPEAKDFKIEQRDDQKFYIVDGCEGSNFVQGPYDTEDAAAARIVTIWLEDAGHEVVNSDLFSSYVKSASRQSRIRRYSITSNGKTVVKSMLFKVETNSIPKTTVVDGRVYIQLDDKLFGPFKSEAEAEGMMKKNYPHVRASKEPKAGPAQKPVKSGAEFGNKGWDWDYANGGLALSYDGMEVAFLQGDEASELYDQLEAASTPEQIGMILDPYLELNEPESGETYRSLVNAFKILAAAKKLPIKSEEAGETPEALPAPEDTTPEYDEAEESDRAEFSKMVLLELQEAQEGTDDELVDDEDLEGDFDLGDEEPIENSKKPVQSASASVPGINQDPTSGKWFLKFPADDSGKTFGPFDDEMSAKAKYQELSGGQHVQSAEEPPLTEEPAEFDDEEMYFPEDEMGEISVDADSGTITVNTTSGDGEPLTVEMTLEGGVLVQKDVDVTDLDGDGEEGEVNTLLPSGSLDLFEESNGDVSVAVDMVLNLPRQVGGEDTIIDMTDEGDPDDVDNSPGGMTA